MGSILVGIMSSSEKMCAFSELSTMTVDLSESNLTYFENFTIEENMRHII